MKNTKTKILATFLNASLMLSAVIVPIGSVFAVEKGESTTTKQTNRSSYDDAKVKYHDDVIKLTTLKDQEKLDFFASCALTPKDHYILAEEKKKYKAIEEKSADAVIYDDKAPEKLAEFKADDNLKQQNCDFSGLPDQDLRHYKKLIFEYLFWKLTGTEAKVATDTTATGEKVVTPTKIEAPKTIIDVTDLREKAHRLEKRDGESETEFTARVFADTDFGLRNGGDEVKNCFDKTELDYLDKRIDYVCPWSFILYCSSNVDATFDGQRIKLHVASDDNEENMTAIDRICVDLTKKYNSTCNFIAKYRLNYFLSNDIQANKFLTVYYNNDSRENYLKYEAYLALEFETRLKQAGLSLDSIANPDLRERIKNADGLDLPKAFADDQPTGLVCFRHEGADRDNKRTLADDVSVNLVDFSDVTTPDKIKAEEQEFNNAYLAAKLAIHNEFIAK